MRALRLWLLLVFLVACQAAPTPTPTPVPIQLRFTYWGSAQEKVAVEAMVQKFESQHPDIDVEAMYIPDDEYMTQVASMIAQGMPPDVGYLLGNRAALWANEGKVLDLTDIIQSDPELSSRLPETYYYFQPGRTLGTNTAVETIVLFYNKAMFDAAQLSYPPATPETAWDWETFVAVAQQLTVDINGKHPNEEGFDPNNIERYAVAFDRGPLGIYYPFISSNGGEVVNSDGTRLMLDTPEAIEAMQRLQDLMWKYHVMPTPEQERNLPPRLAMLQTGRLAMMIDGQWKLLDLANMEGLTYGLGVLPKMKEPRTMILGSPTVIFSGTQQLEAAISFYKFHNNPEAVDLFAQGLWMPLQKSYYTDPTHIAAWLENPAHPAEGQTVLTTYTLCCVVQAPLYYVKNFGQLVDEAIQPAMELIWNNEATAASALQQAVEQAAPLMQGRWDH